MRSDRIYDAQQQNPSKIMPNRPKIEHSDQLSIGFHHADAMTINCEGFWILNPEIVPVPLRSVLDDFQSLIKHALDVKITPTKYGMRKREF